MLPGVFSVPLVSDPTMMQVDVYRPTVLLLAPAAPSQVLVLLVV